MTATLTRRDDTLVFTGALDLTAVVPLWPQAWAQRAGVTRIDLTAVSRVDSAGLAMLAELADGLPGLVVDGRPAGLDELRAAYRLQDDLSFAA